MARIAVKLFKVTALPPEDQLLPNSFYFIVNPEVPELLADAWLTDETSVARALINIEGVDARIVTQLEEELDGFTIDWNSVTGKPTEFPPSAHTHAQYASLDGADFSGFLRRGGSNVLVQADYNEPFGVPNLDAGGKVPAGLLPSFVDDVIEVANFSVLPGTGETGKIYITLDDNKQYRWSGSIYIAISASPGTTDDVPEGVTNLYFTQSRVRDTALTGLDIAGSALANIVNTDHIIVAFGKVQKAITFWRGISKAAESDEERSLIAMDTDPWLTGFNISPGVIYELKVDVWYKPGSHGFQWQLDDSEESTKGQIHYQQLKNINESDTFNGNSINYNMIESELLMTDVSDNDLSVSADINDLVYLKLRGMIHSNVETIIGFSFGARRIIELVISETTRWKYSRMSVTPIHIIE